MTLQHGNNRLFTFPKILTNFHKYFILINSVGVNNYIMYELKLIYHKDNFCLELVS
mgnify:CR=1 FL=1